MCSSSKWSEVEPEYRSKTCCHMLCVMCRVSHVTCHVSHVTIINFYGQSGEAIRQRVCYQWGLPSLVFNVLLLPVPKVKSIID